MINFNVFSSLLSNYTIKEYKKWKNKEYKTNKKLFENFYKDFKKPYSLLIGYGDNILNMLKIFNSNPGNFFFHRNILLLVTKYNKQNSLYPLLSFLEYEVCFLEIKNYFCKLNKKKNSDILFIAQCKINRLEVYNVKKNLKCLGA